MQRIEVANFKVLNIEPRGYAVKNKFWILDNGIKKLVKTSDFNSDQDVIEKLAEVLLKKINVDCVNVQLGYDSNNQKNCCLITSFLTDEADVSLSVNNWNLVRGDSTFDKIQACLNQLFHKYESLKKISSSEVESIKKAYIRSLFGKCIIENYDFKLDNIGLIFNEKSKQYRLPPSFDNGFSFRSYNLNTDPICFIGNQFFGVFDIISYIIENYFDYVSDIVESLSHLVETDLENTINQFSDEILDEKRNYAINYIKEINQFVNQKINNKKR